ncbi:MAG: hypothetical protein AB8C84_01410 [Oligoflexales bacterium]
MKILKKLGIALLPLGLWQCGSLEDAVELQNYLAQLQLADCFETSDEGYVPESSTATDDEAETEELTECQADLTEVYDVDGDGEISEAEGTELEAHIKERQTARNAACTEEGITDETACLAHHKAQRKILREIAITSCLLDYDADSDSSLSKTEMKACHDAKKAERKEIRKDLRCQNDDNNECGPIKLEKMKTIAKSKEKTRKTFVDDTAPGGVIGDKTAAAKKLKDASTTKAAERSPRKAANETKASAGNTARKSRGKVAKAATP